MSTWDEDDVEVEEMKGWYKKTICGDEQVEKICADLNVDKTYLAELNVWKRSNICNWVEYVKI